MPIRNYSSDQSPEQSAGRIQGMLAERGGRNMSYDYDEDGNMTCLRFSMPVNDITMWFELTVNVEAMLQALDADKKVPMTKCNMAQARRTAWKNKSDWLHLQLTEIDSGQADIVQLMLGYAVTLEGKSLYRAIMEGSQHLMLGDGSGR